MYKSNSAPIFWDGLGLPILLNQLSAYAPPNVDIRITTEVDGDVTVKCCFEGHVHVRIGMRAAYADSVAGLLSAVAAARLLAAGDVPTRETMDVGALALLREVTPNLTDLPPGALRLIFPDRGEMH